MAENTNFSPNPSFNTGSPEFHLSTSPLYMKILFLNFPCSWVWPGSSLASKEGHSPFAMMLPLAGETEQQRFGPDSVTFQGNKTVLGYSGF